MHVYLYVFVCIIRMCICVCVCVTLHTGVCLSETSGNESQYEEDEIFTQFSGSTHDGCDRARSADHRQHRERKTQEENPLRHLPKL